jgi:hypothetical protein
VESGSLQEGEGGKLIYFALIRGPVIIQSTLMWREVLESFSGVRGEAYLSDPFNLDYPELCGGVFKSFREEAYLF